MVRTWLCHMGVTASLFAAAAVGAGWKWEGIFH